MLEKTVLETAQNIIKNLSERNIKIATAESCTGGALSALFTEISGSSKVFDRGFVTYSNEAKAEMLGVKFETLEEFGAVSSQVAEEMSLGALKNSQADFAIAITGIAGPKSDDTNKPVGLVYIAIASEQNNSATEFNFAGTRHDIRVQSIASALSMLEISTQTHK